MKGREQNSTRTLHNCSTMLPDTLTPRGVPRMGEYPTVPKPNILFVFH